FVDDDGNIFFADSREQKDFGDSYGNQGAITSHSINDLPPVQYDGYGFVDYNGVRYWPAAEVVLKTGFIDLGRADDRKAFAAAVWSVVQGSRGLLEITFRSMNSGISVTRTFGDMGAYGFMEVQKCLLSLNGSAVS